MSLRFKNMAEARKVLGDRPLLREIRRSGGDPSPHIVSSSNSKGAKSPAQDALWSAVKERYEFLGPVDEYGNCVPGRKFRIDIAFPTIKLAIEVDGWQYHGKFKSGFKKDREKQNLLVVNGWRVLRFTAGQIFEDLEGVLKQISSSVLGDECEIRKD